jgi:hypothetical protein
LAQATRHATLHLVHVGAGILSGEESALLQRVEHQLREKRVPFTSEVLRRGTSPIEDLTLVK